MKATPISPKAPLLESGETVIIKAEFNDDGYRLADVPLYQGAGGGGTVAKDGYDYSVENQISFVAGYGGSATYSLNTVYEGDTKKLGELGETDPYDEYKGPGIGLYNASSTETNYEISFSSMKSSEDDELYMQSPLSLMKKKADSIQSVSSSSLTLKITKGTLGDESSYEQTTESYAVTSDKINVILGENEFVTYAISGNTTRYQFTVNEEDELISSGLIQSSDLTKHVFGTEAVSENDVEVIMTSLSLQDNLYINTYISIPEGLAEEELTAYLSYDKDLSVDMNFKLDGTGFVKKTTGDNYTYEYQVTYYESFTTGGNSYPNTYRISFHNVAAKEMNIRVNLEVKNSEGENLTLVKGENGYTKFSMSVKDYAALVFEKSTDEKLINLCKSLMNYGYSAQQQFSYNTDNLVETYDYDSNMSAVSADDLSDYEIKCTSGKSIDEIKSIYGYKMASLVLRSETSIYLYFTQKPDTVTVDGTEVEPVAKGSEWIVQIGGIKVRDLDAAHTFYTFIIVADQREIPLPLQ